MNGNERREAIVRKIKQSEQPLSGTKLAREYAVSRQVIVQDIALIRAHGYDIISTNRGYILNTPKTLSSVLKVSHTDDDIEKELQIVVDLGGTVVDVFVWHKAYGKIACPLNIDSRRKIDEFVENIKSGKSSPLKNITSNYHYHTIEAKDRKTLHLIEAALEAQGFLIEEVSEGK